MNFIIDPTKYFGCVLGAQVNCDVKNERYIVNGSHDATRLQDLLDGFIKKYVLCASCDNPETTLLVNQKKGTISASCKACGHLSTISSQDKLTTYILKCPPDQQHNAPGASVSKRKKKERDDIKYRKDGQNGRSGSPQHDSDEATTTLNETNGGGGEQKIDPDNDWCDPTDVAEDLDNSALKKLTLNEDLEKSVHQRMQIFYDFVKVNSFLKFVSIN